MLRQFWAPWRLRSVGLPFSSKGRGAHWPRYDTGSARAWAQFQFISLVVCRSPAASELSARVGRWCRSIGGDGWVRGREIRMILPVRPRSSSPPLPSPETVSCQSQWSRPDLTAAAMEEATALCMKAAAVAPPQQGVAGTPPQQGATPASPQQDAEVPDFGASIPVGRPGGGATVRGGEALVAASLRGRGRTADGCET